MATPAEIHIDSADATEFRPKIVHSCVATIKPPGATSGSAERVEMTDLDFMGAMRPSIRCHTFLRLGDQDREYSLRRGLARTRRVGSAEKLRLNCFRGGLKR